MDGAAAWQETGNRIKKAQVEQRVEREIKFGPKQKAQSGNVCP